MLIKLAIVFVLILIVGSLFSALFFLAKDKGASERTAKALTVRVTLSILLFLGLMLAYAAGLIGHS
ncbi:MAG: DUF2909 domain-containing protein [Betaproteobacteria bacterium HGW-Betaproteobacteria-1]|jgi:uncharacterized membrane protein|nr:MAG: DUF2909 domain-containing protein [Betaproteobacteria bacterium HGW-Betaproteobacteria-1]